jgi:hypothetical protein
VNANPYFARSPFGDRPGAALRERLYHLENLTSEVVRALQQSGANDQEIDRCERPLREHIARSRAALKRS